MRDQAEKPYKARLYPAFIKLLAAANFDRARPTLQYYLAHGDNVGAERALAGLLKQPWDGQLDYALSLLAHRAKGVREHISKWLVAQGQAAVEGIASAILRSRWRVL